MTSNEKLDNVLEFLLENRDVDGFTLDDAFIRLKDFYPKWADLPEDLDAILRKLEKEGFVLISFDNTGNQGNKHKYYRISFDGRILIENGGYREKQKRIKAETNRQVLLNIIVALGTGLAGLYAFGQILSYLFHHLLPVFCP